MVVHHALLFDQIDLRFPVDSWLSFTAAHTFPIVKLQEHPVSGSEYFLAAYIEFHQGHIYYDSSLAALYLRISAVFPYYRFASCISSSIEHRGSAWSRMLLACNRVESSILRLVIQKFYPTCTSENVLNERQY